MWDDVVVIKKYNKALEENIIPDDLQDFMPMLRDLAEISKILNRMRPS